MRLVALRFLVLVYSYAVVICCRGYQCLKRHRGSLKVQAFTLALTFHHLTAQHIGDVSGEDKFVGVFDAVFLCPQCFNGVVCVVVVMVVGAMQVRKLHCLAVLAVMVNGIVARDTGDKVFQFRPTVIF